MATRRCVNCNNKTGEPQWIGNKCPICYSGLGWTESKHGGLRDVEIEAARRALTRFKDSDIIDLPTRHGKRSNER